VLLQLLLSNQKQQSITAEAHVAGPAVDVLALLLL
jgi:hypothetical protein